MENKSFWETLRKDLLQGIESVSEEMRSGFSKLESTTKGRFDEIDERLDGVDKRLDGVDKRLDGVDKRLDGVDKRLDGLDKRLGDTIWRVTRLQGDVQRGLTEIGNYLMSLDLDMGRRLELLEIRVKLLESDDEGSNGSR